LIGRKDFHKLPLDKENKFKEGHGQLLVWENFVLYFGKEEEDLRRGGE
jgi:hypothetical protein